MQELQKQLLELLLKEVPEAMYPAAMCALADLREVSPELSNAHAAQPSSVVALYSPWAFSMPHHGFLTRLSSAENLQVYHRLWQWKQ